MHVAFLTPEYPSPLTGRSGGIGTSVAALARELVQLGDKVTVFVYGQSNDQNWEDQGVQLHSIAQKRYAIGTWYFYRKYINRVVNQLISEKQIELLEVPDYTGITAFMRFSIPVVMRLHGSDTYFCQLEGRPQKRKNRWLERLAFQKANYFIAPTEFAAQFSLKAFQLANKSVTVIPHGIATAQFTNAHPESFKPFSLVYVGTFIRKKGVLHLPAVLNALIKSFPNLRVTLVGKDAADVQTQQLSTRQLFEEACHPSVLKQVQFVGNVPWEEVKTYMTDAQVVVLPTLAETFGLVTIEAMALAKTVVSSDRPWVSELIDHGVTGYQIDPEVAESFLNQLAELLANPSVCVSVGKAASEHVRQRFDLTQIAKLNQAFYKVKWTAFTKNLKNK